MTESDNGSIFTYTLTTRFGILLDKGKYPLDDFSFAECSNLGGMSNGSVNGPDNYPIGFEVMQNGVCLLRNGDFHVRIVGVGGQSMNRETMAAQQWYPADASPHAAPRMPTTRAARAADTCR